MLKKKGQLEQQAITHGQRLENSWEADMKQTRIKSVLYNFVILGLFLCGLYFFLLRFSGAAILILFRDDVKFGSDYWLDQPMVAYAGMVVTYVIHWLLLSWGCKHLLIPKYLLWVYFAFDVLVLCGTGLCFFLLLLVVLTHLTEELTNTEVFRSFATIILLILPQLIVCSVLFFIRTRSLKKTD